MRYFLGGVVVGGIGMHLFWIVGMVIANRGRR